MFIVVRRLFKFLFYDDMDVPFEFTKLDQPEL